MRHIYSAEYMHLISTACGLIGASQGELLGKSREPRLHQARSACWVLYAVWGWHLDERTRWTSMAADINRPRPTTSQGTRKAIAAVQRDKDFAKLVLVIAKGAVSK